MGQNMSNDLKADAEQLILAKLIELVHLCEQRSINISELFRRAIEITDYDPYRY